MWSMAKTWQLCSSWLTSMAALTSFFGARMWWASRPRKCLTISKQFRSFSGPSKSFCRIDHLCNSKWNPECLDLYANVQRLRWSS
jgi:hypothetical protein